MPRLTETIRNLPQSAPFIGPETLERRDGKNIRARIGANESAFGPSPRAVAAMAEAAAQSWKYGDAECHDLRAALAARHGVGMGNIVVGAGADSLLGSLARLVVAPGTPVVTSRGAYPTFAYHIAACGGAIHKVPYRDDAQDTEALAATSRTVDAALTYLANPDNPTASWTPAGAVRALIDALPEDGLLCLDEAYSDFAPADALLPLDVAETRVIRIRTFSKAHGMAGVRVGYALGHADLITRFNLVRNHFGVSRIAQAGALAALADTAWLAQVVARVARGRARLAGIARANGLTPLPSATNFVAIDCGRDGAYARAVVEAMQARGVFIRMGFVAPQDRCIRVSVGTDADLDLFEAELPGALAAAGLRK